MGENYCGHCGQARVHAHVTLHDIAHEATHEFLHLDGKIGRTLRTLVATPGQLTVDFLAGRRARYISPVRLYLTFSVLFFFLAATFGQLGKDIIKVGSGPTPKGKVVSAPSNIDRRLEHGAKELEHNPNRLGEELGHNLPRAMFLLMPFFALLLMLAYRKRQPYYVPHLYFSIHFHAFVFLLLSVVVLLQALHVTAIDAVADVLTLASLPYLFVAARRVYGGGWGVTTLKCGTIAIVYWIALMLTILGLVFLVLLD